MANGLTTISVGGVAQLLFQTGGTVPAPASPNYTPVATLLDENQVPLMPAAAAITDAATNPTTTAVDARLSAYNGATWDRLKSTPVSTAAMTTGVLAVADRMWIAGNQYSVKQAASELTDATSGQTVPGAAGLSFNGSTWDRLYGNTIGTLLASAARTATASGPLITNYNSRGVILFLYITATNPTTTFRVVIEAPDPVSGATLQVSPTAISPPVNTTGIFGFMFYPGASAQGAGTVGYILQSSPIALPRRWTASVYPSDAASVTYSLGYALIN